MKTLLPAGVLLILLGAGFAWSAITETGSLRPPSDQPAVTMPAPVRPGATEAPRRVVLLEGALAGLLIAVGFVAIGIGIGNWRHPRLVSHPPRQPL